MADNYFELLKHPEWQKKRLRIMERDGFACRECGDKDTTLNVHHSYYTKGAKPWDYPDESLQCLCEPCHEARHAINTELKAVVGCLEGRSDEGLVLGFAKALLAIQECGGAIDGESLRLCSYEEVEGAVIGYSARVLNICDTHPVTRPIAEQVISLLSANGEITDTAICDVIIASHETFGTFRDEHAAAQRAKSECPKQPDHEWQRSALRA